MSRSRKYLLIGIVGLNAIAAMLLVSSRTDYRVDLSSTVEIWGDVVRDLDKFGLTVTSVSIDKEIEIGDEMAKTVRTAADTDLQKYVDQVGQGLATHVRRRGIPYRFHVVTSPDVNAFAVAGGHVFVTSGMLERIKSEAELASILAHEIAHVDLKHTIEMLQYELLARRVLGDDLATIVRIARYLVTVSYSEQQEREADRYGLILMADAGYSPLEGIRAFVGLLGALHPEVGRPKKPKQPELEIGRALEEALEDYFATHPVWPDRVRDLNAILDRNMASWEGKKLYIGRSNYRDRVPRSADEREDETILYSADSPELQFIRGILMSQAGDHGQAISYLSKAIASDPKMLAAYRARAKAYANRGDYEESLSDLTVVGDAWATDLEELRTRLESLPGDATQADRLDLLSQTIDLMGDLRSAKEDVAKLLQELERRKEYATTMGQLDGLSRELANLSVERGFMRLDIEEYEGASEDFDFALSIDEKNSAAINGRDIIRYSVEIQRYPRNSRTYNNRGLAYDNNGQYDRAIADYNTAIEINPKYSIAYRNRGRAYKAKGELDRAIADYDRAIEINPEYVLAYNSRGIAYKDKGELDRAIADYERAIELDWDFTSAYINRGRAYQKKGEYDNAIADFDRAIKLDPDSTSAYNNIAWLLATAPSSKHRDGKKAVKMAEKAVELEPGNPDHVDTLAAAYAEAGRFSDAVSMEKKAIDLLEAQGKDAAAADFEARLKLYLANEPFHE